MGPTKNRLDVMCKCSGVACCCHSFQPLYLSLSLSYFPLAHSARTSIPFDIIIIIATTVNEQVLPVSARYTSPDLSPQYQGADAMNEGVAPCSVCMWIINVGMRLRILLCTVLRYRDDVPYRVASRSAVKKKKKKAEDKISRRRRAMT